MIAIRPNRMRCGIFLAPFHPVDEDPTLALRRDIELIEHLDHLGFDEAWIGEHHSAGYEIIASPELMIAAAAERTQRIPGFWSSPLITVIYDRTSAIAAADSVCTGSASLPAMAFVRALTARRRWHRSL